MPLSPTSAPTPGSNSSTGCSFAALRRALGPALARRGPLSREDQAHTFQARTYPSGYRYRDWVVQAFNDDLPYDQFVTRADRRRSARRARTMNDTTGRSPLGYFALGPVYYADAGCAFKASLDELDDRIDTLARGFLGLTIACARCHDHKFDPISQQDYYALAGDLPQFGISRSCRSSPRTSSSKYELAQKQDQRRRANGQETSGA